MIAMTWLLPALLAALALAAAPASAQQGRGTQPSSERQALVNQCDADAGAKKLSGTARGSFISDCLARKPPAGEASAGAGRPSHRDDASNAQQKDIQDAQFRKWSSVADRAMKSICVGCGQGAAARPTRARRRAPVEDDVEYGRGTAGADGVGE
jgi:hypothetical protein